MRGQFEPHLMSDIAVAVTQLWGSRWWGLRGI